MTEPANPARAQAGSSIPAEARARRTAIDRVLSPTGVLGGLVLAFIAITAWWLTQEDSVPDSATANHLLVALQYHDAIRNGDLLAPFETFNVYPPLLHVVGMLGLLAGGVGLNGPIMAESLVFVPLLALGCYGAGSVAYGPRVGVLAALFALGTPMVLAHLHVFMLDLALTAIVAVTVWLILASERFSKPGYSLAAGVVAGLGMMTKHTFPLFIVALLAVVLVRGGRRNLKGLTAFAIAAVVVGAPWYLQHLGEISTLTSGALGERSFTPQNPPRLSLKSFLWYGANALEFQAYLPLLILFLAGLVIAVRRWLRQPSANEYLPELAIGGLGGYVALTLLTVKDPRYTLPCLVFVSVLATAWLVRPNGSLRLLPVTALVIVVVVNVMAIDFGAGGSQRISMPGNWSNAGFLNGEVTLSGAPAIPEAGRGEPHDDGVRDLLQAARDDGVRELHLGANLDDWRSFNGNGLALFIRMTGLRSPYRNDPRFLTRGGLSLIRHVRTPADPRPCLLLEDGSGVYLAKIGRDFAPEKVPFEELDFYCPPGYPRASP